jgi:hypothetical protein
LISRYLIFWLILAAAGVANGVLREATYGRQVSNLAAHQLSTVTGIFLTGGVVWALNRFWPIRSANEAWIIGVCWLLMTVIFEFGFGHYVAGHSWARLLADYNLAGGRVWPLFLAWITVLPYVTWRLANA